MSQTTIAEDVARLLSETTFGLGASTEMMTSTAAPAIRPVVQSIGAHLGGVYMVLVAFQVGLEPAAMQACVAQSVSGQSLVLAELAFSMLLALLLTPREAFWTWSLWDSAVWAGPPALAYAIRSLLKTAAYRRCDGVTFNVINQTKVVFCATAAWVMMAEAQSLRQCCALLCAVAAGALLVAPQVASKIKAGEGDLPVSAADAGKSLQKKLNSSQGALFALAAAACAGFAAALSQRVLRGTKRPCTLYNFELALWGAPFTLLSNTAALRQPQQLLHGWTPRTLGPILMQAAGGLLVSAVVQSRGGVAMGLCTVGGIAVSAMAETCLKRRPPPTRQVLAAFLAALSIIGHQLDQLQVTVEAPAVKPAQPPPPASAMLRAAVAALEARQGSTVVT
eukprot:TRINITY_DN7976_c0_g1_i1.p1 TRINITY_DN7976_c0_g1~~TRINITY_DN7976_c0_g1_i1.p1  ORF type:complete len:393 (+),score=68.17 TRINITY_DN7976_c0_g1_i1:188-1366(+)